jgi:Na+-driven multidrug efflux pump
METKTFSIVTTFSMIFTLTAVSLGIVAFAISGFYPGIIVLFLVALIPLASKFYAKKISANSHDSHRNYFTLLTIINLLIILVVLWMSFVILHDRVLGDCC